MSRTMNEDSKRTAFAMAIVATVAFGAGVGVRQSMGRARAGEGPVQQTQKIIKKIPVPIPFPMSSFF